MSAKDQREAIGTLFVSGWGSVPPNPRLVTPNEPKEPTEGEWARLTILDSDSFPVEIGRSNVQRRSIGNVIVNVFVPLGTGDNRALALADKAAKVFTDSPRIACGVSADLRFRDPVIRPQGKDSTGNFYQVNVTVPYWRDSVI